MLTFTACYHIHKIYILAPGNSIFGWNNTAERSDILPYLEEKKSQTRSTRMYDEICGCINIASQELNRNFIWNHSLTISVKKKGIRSNEDDWNVKVNGRRTSLETTANLGHWSEWEIQGSAVLYNIINASNYRTNC